MGRHQWIDLRDVSPSETSGICDWTVRSGQEEKSQMADRIIFLSAQKSKRCLACHVGAVEDRRFSAPRGNQKTHSSSYHACLISCSHSPRACVILKLPCLFSLPCRSGPTRTQWLPSRTLASSKCIFIPLLALKVKDILRHVVKKDHSFKKKHGMDLGW